MAFDITILSRSGLSESELLTMRARLVTAITTGDGQSIQSTSTRDLSVTFAQNTKQEDLLLAVNYALQKLDPDTYGDSNTRQKRKFVQ